MHQVQGADDNVLGPLVSERCARKTAKSWMVDLDGWCKWIGTVITIPAIDNGCIAVLMFEIVGRFGVD